MPTEMPVEFEADPIGYVKKAVLDRKRKQEDAQHRYEQQMDKIWRAWAYLADDMKAWAKELGVEIEDVMYD